MPKKLSEIKRKDMSGFVAARKNKFMNCLCNLFDNEVFWLIVIALLILNVTCNCNTDSYCTRGTNYGGCGCG